MKKVVVIALFIFLLLLTLYYIGRHGIVFWPTYPYHNLIVFGLIMVEALLGLFIWIKLIPRIPFIILLIILWMTTEGFQFVFTMASLTGWITLLGFFLIVSASFKLTDSQKKMWLITIVLYLILPFAFSESFHFYGSFLEIAFHSFPYIIAGIHLFYSPKNIKIVMGVGSLLYPSIGLSLLILLSSSSFIKDSDQLVYFYTLTPNGEELLVSEELQDGFIDQMLVITIYYPIAYGFYSVVGDYYQESYSLLHINEGQIEWEEVDDQHLTFKVDDYSISIDITLP